MEKAEERKLARLRRHRRVRKRIYGTAERPRLCVYKSNRGIYAQIINDDLASTLVTASTIDKELREKIKNGSNREAAAKVGRLVAERALKKKINEVVFDRGGNLYHGCVKELADSAREAGLKL